MFYAKITITDSKFLKWTVWILLGSNLLVLKDLTGLNKNGLKVKHLQ